MKKVLFIIFLGYSLNVCAQKSVKIDSIYYLMDTAKTVINDRMWEIGWEGNFKYYTLQCPCLKFDQKPTFFYRTNFEGQILDKRQLNAKKIINLPGLIQKAKEFTSTEYKGKFAIFFIEHAKKKIITHKVSLKEPKKPTVITDYEIIQQDTSKTKKP